jgi:hypothetical protein
MTERIPYVWQCPISGSVWLMTLKCHIGGPFQKFCTLYVFSLKTNVFYTVHLQAFNVISIVLHHSGPTIGQVFHSCQDAFVVDASVTRVAWLDTASMLLKRFPQSGFFNFGNKSNAGGLMSGLYGGWGNNCHPYFSKISDTAPEAWGRSLMYDCWPMREILFQSVSSSVSWPRFAEQGPRGLPIHTRCSLKKCGSQVSRKSERLHHPTGRASAVCRTFEMTYVFSLDPNISVKWLLKN